MKKSNQKGFTIVELVIVIAVIAILAAVLIPTFASLVKKANLSNDKSFVKNVNTTLLIESDAASFATAGDAINALNRNGFSGKYTTYSGGYHYCYSLENNKMYLLDESNTVVYPEENVTVSSLWGLYTDNRTSVVDGITKYVAMTNITNSEHYNDVFASGTYTIDLNGYFISVTADDAVKNNVSVENGVLINGATAGEDVNEGYTLFESAEDRIETAELDAIASVDGSTKTIKNTIFTKRVYINARSTNYVFDNCIFYGGAALNFDDASGTNDGIIAEIKNCSFIDIGEAWAILSHRSLTVTGCTFTNLTSRGAIQVQENSNNMTVSISDCTFSGTAGVYPTIRFVGKDPRCSNTNAGVVSFMLFGNSFTALNKSTGLIGFSGTGSTLYNYSGSGVTVTISNNTIAENISADQYVVTAGDDNTLATLFGGN